MKRIILFSFLLIFIIPNLLYAGVINSAHNANCCSVWVTGKNPTWMMAFDKSYGGTIRTFRQPRTGSNIASPESDYGSLSDVEMNLFGIGWASICQDNSANITVVESTSTRFRIYIESDIVKGSADSGDVQDTVTIYYNRQVHDRRAKLNAGTSVRGAECRLLTWNFKYSEAVEDTLVFADDDEIDKVNNINSGAFTLPADQDTVHAQQLFMDNTDTSMVMLWFRTLFPDQVGYYVSHDHSASDRRGAGVATSNLTYRSGSSWWQGKFVFWLGTFDHDGYDMQDYFIDYMNPSPITLTYGGTTGGRWQETRGCYHLVDGGSDSIRFTFDKATWADTVHTPVIEIASWDGAIPDSIKVGGTKKVLNTDFYADTVDAKNFLIIHYLSDITADTEFEIPMRGAGAPPGGANKLLLKRQQRK